MQVKQDTYPIFEPNQVLTNRHLNQVFDYLDEQARLTRANLIGIGVVCGLEIQLAADGKSITLTKGCGVTSQGYLLVEPPLEETATQREEVSLVEYKTYQLPDEVEEYLPFKFDGTDVNGNSVRIQYPLWELFEAGEQGSTKLGDAPTGFLNDKAVLLFLELKKDGLRNCSPNNCDDKGFDVAATVRRLLIQRSDLDKIIAKTNGLNTDITPADLEASLSKRINLPDLRLPRFNVPNSNPTTSNQIFAAFFEVFHTHKLAKSLVDTLNTAYIAFQPILEKQYPNNPFGSFSTNFGFLDSAPQNAVQVRFLQYYYDFFDDIIKAYDEFRWKGLELICACCPPAELFPRHLMLGVLNPPANVNTAIYRHLFLSSSAISGCEEHTADVVHLFQRLVEMTNRFTIAPPLPTQPKDATNDVQIRITPSKLADVKPSDKAIPYYYLQNGAPSLYKLWNAKKSRQNRAHLNLSYRSDEYANPAAPTFVRQPLQYDLEPYNFLRIEGHLGKNYQSVLNTLLSLKTQYRLPIDIIALRSGIFDETQPVDLSKENCRFEDLEALYETHKADLVGFLCKEVQYFYDMTWRGQVSSTKAKPKLKLLVDCAPDYQYTLETIGHSFEMWIGAQPGNKVPDIDPNIILNFIRDFNLGQNDWIIFYVVIYLAKFYEQLPANLTDINWVNLDKTYKDLISVTKSVETEREQNANKMMDWEEVDDRLEDILYKCAMEPLKAMYKELEARIKQVKQKQFLSFFLKDNPGIQHKAGVPLGGTFILVYHDDPEPVVVGQQLTLGNLAFLDLIGGNTATIANNLAVNRANNLNVSAVSESLTRIRANQQLLLDQDIRFLIGTLTGNVPIKDIAPVVIVNKDADQIIAETVDNLPDGTVIADFFVPYLCCSGCSSVQFVLPKLPPTFTTEIGCTNPNGAAEVTIKAEGGVAPYSVKVDNGLFTPLTGAILLNSGAHNVSIKDSEGTESGIQTIQIAVKLDLSSEKLTCINNNSAFLAEYVVSGGITPYKVNRGTINGDKYISDPIPSDTEAEIIITDKKGCTVSRKVRRLCVDPLVFAESLGCTGADGASLTIEPSGGVPPYQVKVDAGNYIDLADLGNLAIGSHSIVVRDSRGTETTAKTIDVPLPLTLSAAGFTQTADGLVTARVAVSGGTLPYTVDGKEITGTEFFSKPDKNGTVVTVEVTDAKKCTAKQDITLAFEAPCDLPCEGQSRRGEYRLWVQPADPQREILYRDYSSKGDVKFRYNGKDFPIEIQTLRKLRERDLNEKYDVVMEEIARELNEAVAKAIDRAGILVFTYQKEAQLPFKTMQIEHFECEKFTLEFEYNFIQSQFTFNYQVRYSNEVDPATNDAFDGVVVSNLRSDKRMRVPAFDISTRNQCKNDNFAPVCISRVPKVDFKGEQGDIFVQLAGSVIPATTKVVAWIWEIPLAEEAFFVGEKIDILPQSNPKETPVRLTAITDSGCFGLIDKTML